MMPSNWTKLPRREQLRQATDLFTSPSGKLVISEALYCAIQLLRSAPEKSREVSNIEDMEMLYETIFDQFAPSNGHEIHLPLGHFAQKDTT